MTQRLELQMFLWLKALQTRSYFNFRTQILYFMLEML
jgi:hypothetical protein